MAEQTAEAERPTSKDYSPTFKAVNPAEVPSQTRAGKTDELIREFLDAQIPAAELEGQPKTFMVSLNNWRKKHTADAAKVSWKSVGGRIYLYNTELMAQHAAEASTNGDG